MPFAEMTPDEIAKVKAFGYEHYSVKQAAAIIGVTPRTVMSYISDQKIHCTKVGGRWSFSREDIEAFISGGK